MKKAIIGMIMSMVIALGIGGFVTTINYYENRLAEADSKYRRDIDEVENLKDKEYDEMKSKYDEAIYNIVNGENYEVTIEHKSSCFYIIYISSGWYFGGRFRSSRYVEY